jgi:hypothetical protein
MEWVILHGGHAHSGASEWLGPILLGAGIGTALIARWVGRMRRRPPHDDEPI